MFYICIRPSLIKVVSVNTELIKKKSLTKSQKRWSKVNQSGSTLKEILTNFCETNITIWGFPSNTTAMAKSKNRINNTFKIYLKIDRVIEIQVMKLISLLLPLSLHSENIRKTYGFVMFSGNKERVHWEQMG